MYSINSSTVKLLCRGENRPIIRADLDNVCLSYLCYFFRAKITRVVHAFYDYPTTKVGMLNIHGIL